MVGCAVFISTTSSFLDSSFLVNNPLEVTPTKSPPPALTGTIPRVLGNEYNGIEFSVFNGAFKKGVYNLVSSLGESYFSGTS